MCREEGGEGSGGAGWVVKGAEMGEEGGEEGWWWRYRCVCEQSQQCCGCGFLYLLGLIGQEVGKYGEEGLQML